MFFLASDPLLFPCFGGRVFGEPYRSEAEMHRKAKSRCEMSLEAAKSSLLRGLFFGAVLGKGKMEAKTGIF